MHPIIERERIAIIGSRVFANRKLVEDFVRELPLTSVIVTGGWWRGGIVQATRGVDEWAAFAANNRGLIVQLVAGSQRDGGLAGKKRNPEIIRDAHRVVAFWDGQSPGTRGGFDIAESFKIPLIVYGSMGEIMMPPY